MPIVANTKEFLDVPESSMHCLFLESSSQKVDSHIYLRAWTSRTLQSSVFSSWERHLTLNGSQEWVSYFYLFYACLNIIYFWSCCCYKQQCHSLFALPKNDACSDFRKLCAFIRFNQMIFKLHFQNPDKSVDMLNKLSLGQKEVSWKDENHCLVHVPLYIPFLRA